MMFYCEVSAECKSKESYTFIYEFIAKIINYMFQSDILKTVHKIRLRSRKIPSMTK